jgi:hypothetical protein
MVSRSSFTMRVRCGAMSTPFTANSVLSFAETTTAVSVSTISASSRSRASRLNSSAVSIAARSSSIGWFQMT